MEHKPVRGIEYRSGWEKTLDRKLAKTKRQYYFSNRFCDMVKKGTPENWTPYNPNRSTRAEIIARLYPQETDA